MKTTKWIASAMIAGAGMLNGCAHHPAAATTTETEMNSVAAARPAAAPPSATSTALSDGQQDADLQAMLNGTSIYFAFNEDLLTPASETRLQALAAKLTQYPDAKINVDGNCDERGTEEYNLALGQRRAEVVKTYLANLGIDASRVHTLSYGKEHPADPAHTETAWAANRRDDMQRQAAN